MGLPPGRADARRPRRLRVRAGLALLTRHAGEQPVAPRPALRAYVTTRRESISRKRKTV